LIIFLLHRFFSKLLLLLLQLVINDYLLVGGKVLEGALLSTFFRTISALSWRRLGKGVNFLAFYKFYRSFIFFKVLFLQTLIFFIILIIANTEVRKLLINARFSVLILFLEIYRINPLRIILIPLIILVLKERIVMLIIIISQLCFKEVLRKYALISIHLIFLNRFEVRIVLSVIILRVQNQVEVFINRNSLHIVHHLLIFLVYLILVAASLTSHALVCITF
jgi:hypothetical protein